MLRPTYPIRTRRLLLRPFTADDLAALYAIQSRPDVTRYLLWGPRSLPEVREVLAKRARSVTLEDEGDTLNLAMTLPESGALVGDVSLHWVSAEHRLGEVGFVLHPDHHGKSYAGEAAAVMLCGWASRSSACTGSSAAATPATPPAPRSWSASACAGRRTSARTS
jgi:RimJ/RimL family protein N-acetyltransferase